MSLCIQNCAESKAGAWEEELMAPVISAESDTPIKNETRRIRRSIKIWAKPQGSAVARNPAMWVENPDDQEDNSLPSREFHLSNSKARRRNSRATKFNLLVYSINWQMISAQATTNLWPLTNLTVKLSIAFSSTSMCPWRLALAYTRNASYCKIDNPNSYFDYL